MLETSTMVSAISNIILFAFLNGFTPRNFKTEDAKPTAANINIIGVNVINKSDTALAQSKKPGRL